MGRKLTLHERLWSKIQKFGPDDCWPWTGHAVHSGHGGDCYGILYFRVGPRKENRKTYRTATNLVYEEINGPIPAGREICHKCHNTLCCNPHHLYAGTHQENMDDMVRSGRSLKGSRNPRAVLTDAQRQEALQRRATGETYKQIGDSFGVHLATIHILCKKAGVGREI